MSDIRLEKYGSQLEAALQGDDELTRTQSLEKLHKKASKKLSAEEPLRMHIEGEYAYFVESNFAKSAEIFDAVARNSGLSDLEPLVKVARAFAADGDHEQALSTLQQFSFSFTAVLFAEHEVYRSEKQKSTLSTPRLRDLSWLSAKAFNAEIEALQLRADCLSALKRPRGVQEVNGILVELILRYADHLYPSILPSATESLQKGISDADYTVHRFPPARASLWCRVLSLKQRLSRDYIEKAVRMIFGLALDVHSLPDDENASEDSSTVDGSESASSEQVLMGASDLLWYTADSTTIDIYLYTAIMTLELLRSSKARKDESEDDDDVAGLINRAVCRMCTSYDMCCIERPALTDGSLLVDIYRNELADPGDDEDVLWNLYILSLATVGKIKEAVDVFLRRQNNPSYARLLVATVLSRCVHNHDMDYKVALKLVSVGNELTIEQSSELDELLRHLPGFLTVEGLGDMLCGTNGFILAASAYSCQTWDESKDRRRRALSYLEQPLESAPKIYKCKLLHALALEYAELREINKAISFVRDALQQNEKHGPSWVLLSTLLTCAKDHEAAIWTCRSALSIGVSDPLLLIVLLRSHSALGGDSEEVTALYKRVLAEMNSLDYRFASMIKEKRKPDPKQEKADDDDSSSSSSSSSDSDSDDDVIPVPAGSAPCIVPAPTQRVMKVLELLATESSSLMTQSSEFGMRHDAHLGHHVLRYISETLNQLNVLSPLIETEVIISKCHTESGVPDGTKGRLEELLLCQPGDPRVLFELALLEHTAGNLDLAKLYFQKALDSSPTTYSLWHGIGRVYRDMGMAKDACDCFVFAAKLRETSPIIPFDSTRIL